MSELTIYVGANGSGKSKKLSDKFIEIRKSDREGYYPTCIYVDLQEGCSLRVARLNQYDVESTYENTRRGQGGLGNYLAILEVVGRYQPNILIVDYPEKNLHIDLQEKFIKTLIELNHGMDIYVATHSPEIVGEYDDYVAPLLNGVEI